MYICELLLQALVIEELISDWESKFPIPTTVNFRFSFILSPNFSNSWAMCFPYFPTEFGTINVNSPSKAASNWHYLNISLKLWLYEFLAIG
jgi:hypothetical protein